MTLAIIVATYKRTDGSTPEILKRAIDSLKQQTYQDYKVFVIGDGYEDQEEFDSFKEFLPEGKYHLENLPYSVERTKYKVPSKELWAVGGTTPINTGIDRALEQGISHICMLDHDCIFYPDHLELINKAISITNSPFIITKGSYTNSYNHTEIIPKIPFHGTLEVDYNSYYNITPDIKAYPFFPSQCMFMKLAVCMDMSRIPIRFRDALEETGRIAAGDADMWNRVRELMKTSVIPEVGILIDKETCSNFDEGYAQTNS